MNEEKFCALLSLAGVAYSRATVTQAFRLDASLAEVLTWIARNVTETNVVDPQLRDDYERITRRPSLLTESDTEEAWEDEDIDDENLEDLIQKEQELEKRLQKRSQKRALLKGLEGQLEDQVHKTRERLNYAYQEDDVFVSPFVREAGQKGQQQCHRLMSLLHGYASQLIAFSEILKGHSTKLHFTQADPQLYWKEAEKLHRQLERLQMDVTSCSTDMMGIPSRVEELITLSDVSHQDWFQELERLRQYNHVSEWRRIEIMTMKARNEKCAQCLQQWAEEYTQSSNLVSSLKGHVKVEDLDTEYQKLTLQKKTLLHRLLPEMLKRTVGRMGLDVIKEYIGRMMSDWNVMIIQRQEFLEQLCDQFDRNRVFTMLAEIERRKVMDMITYLQDLDRTFRTSAEISCRRRRSYGRSKQPVVDFVHPDDDYLHLLSNFITFCGEKTIDCDVPGMEWTQTQHKRHYSMAFSEKSAAGSVNPSPMSKPSKERREHTSAAVSPMTPAELESSLRRLSVEVDQGRSMLFGDSPPESVPSSVAFHEMTLQANRLLSLPSPSHLAVASTFPDTFAPMFMEFNEGIEDIMTRLFRFEDDRLVPAIPGARSAMEAVDRLIQQLNEISATLKTEFNSFIAYLERHPEDVTKRQNMARFFIQ